MRRRLIRLVLCVALLLVIGGLGTGWWALQQTQHVPEFYAKATAQLDQETLEARRERRLEARRRFQQEMEQLQTQASRIGSWKATFSADQINAWLIEELPTKFPRLLASGASEPRIAIENGRLLAAVRYKNRRIDTVISCELKVELTEEANMLALHVTDLKAGALPLPLGKFRKGISQEAAKGGVDIRWDDTERGPIALVNVPREHPGYASTPVIVEMIQLLEGQLILSGHTGPLAQESYRPRGPIYQFVSYRPGEKRNRQATTRVSSSEASSSKTKLR